MPETPGTPAVVTPPAATAATPIVSPADLNGAAPAVPLPPAEKPLGARFAALSKKENEIRAEREAFKNEQQAFKNEQATFQTEREKMRGVVDAIANAKADPVALLKTAGITYDELTRFILQDGKPDPLDRIAELDQKIEDEKKARAKAEEDRIAKDTEAQTTYITQMIDDYRKETNEHISSDPVAYELIIAYDAQDHVFSKIRDHFAATGKIISPEEAAKAVEAELEQTVEELAKLPKFQARLKPPEPEKKTPPQKTETRAAPRSLSVQQVSPASPAKPVVLDRNERLKRASEKLIFTDRK